MFNQNLEIRSGLSFKQYLKLDYTMRHIHYYFKRKMSKIFTKYRSHSTAGNIKVHVTAPQMNYQTTQIPLYLMEHFVKSLGLANTFNAIHLSVSL